MTDAYSVYLVNFTLWTTYIGLDIVNPSKHSSFTLFDLAARSVKSFIQQKPELCLDIYTNNYTYWPDFDFNIRFLLLLSSTFRDAVSKNEIERDVIKRPVKFYWDDPYERRAVKFHWKIPCEYTLMRKLILRDVLGGEYGQTCKELKSHVLEFFEWLDIPIICKIARVDY